MVRNGYRLNFRHRTPLPVFGGGSLGNLRGFRRLPPTWTVQWDHFLQFDTAPINPNLPQQSGLIDLSLAPSLANLPPDVAGPEVGDGQDAARKVLFARNIERGYQLSLPPGQAVASAIGETPLSPLIDNDGDPLWVYVLREAREQHGGKKLGKVGSTIVAETIVGLIAGDRLSYLNVKPRWRPAEGKGFYVPAEGKAFCLRDIILEAEMPIHREHLEDKGGFKDEYDPRATLLDKFRASEAQVRAEMRIEMRKTKRARSASGAPSRRGLLPI
jgi:hypothetical protein